MSKGRREPLSTAKVVLVGFDSPTSLNLDRIHSGRRENGFGRNKAIETYHNNEFDFLHQATQGVRTCYLLTISGLIQQFKTAETNSIMCEGLLDHYSLTSQW